MSCSHMGETRNRSELSFTRREGFFFAQTRVEQKLMTKISLEEKAEQVTTK